MVRFMVTMEDLDAIEVGPMTEAESEGLIELWGPHHE